MNADRAADNASAPKPLFRTAALEHAGDRRYGSILLAQPLSHSLLTLLSLGIAVGIILFLALFSYTRKIAVPGALMPTRGVIRIVPPQVGVVTERRVQEGQAVQAGDVLFVLASERLSATHGNAEQTISTLLAARRDSLVTEQAQLRMQFQARLDAGRRRVADLGSEIRRIDDEIATQERRFGLAQTTLKRFNELAASGYVSPVQVQDKQAEALDQQQRLTELQRTRAAAARDLATAQAEVGDTQVQAVRDAEAAHRNIAAAEQDLTENEARREILVRAPQAGTVTAITGEVGQTTSPAQILASVLPEGSELEAELYAPSRAIGFLKPGQDVLLRYQAFPYQKFGQAKGSVKEVSRTALPQNETAVAGPAAYNEPLYRVRVTLQRQTMLAYGQEQALRSGALLESSVVLEKRHLYEWVLEPLYTVYGRVFHDS
jgi:membrane fusion protein